MAPRPIHIRLQLETRVSHFLPADDNETRVKVCPDLPVQGQCSGKHSSTACKSFRVPFCAILTLADYFVRHDLIREAAVTREKMGMMSANHVETVNSLQSLEEDLAGLTKGLEDLKTKIKTEIEGNENHRLKIRQQQEQTNKALEVLTVIAKNEISAAKDAEQHMATDKETTELQTGL
jgi:regulator of replication initiation timing